MSGTGNPDSSGKSIEEANDSIAEAKANESVEQFLTFFMDKEEFGVNILSVQEIRGWDTVTPIPNAPGQVKGVMNLRGTVVPIIDLRMCFDIEDLKYTEETVVIILNVSTTRGSKVMGVVVDAVSDVHNFNLHEIQSAPDLASSAQAQYVKGLGRTDEKMVILLELNDQLICEDERKTGAKPDLVVA